MLRGTVTPLGPCLAPSPSLHRPIRAAQPTRCTSTPVQPAQDIVQTKHRRRHTRGGNLSVEDLPLPTGDWTARIPVVGETFHYINDAADWCNSRVGRHGPVFKTSLFGYDGYCISSFDLIEEVYEGIHHSTVQFQLDAFQELMAGPLTQMTYEKDAHVKIRRQFGSALSVDAVATYLPAIENLARTYTAKWAKQDTIDLELAIRDITMDFSSDLVVGLGLDQARKADLKHHFSNFTKNLNTFNVDLPGTPLRTAKNAKREVLAAIRDEVISVREKALAGDFGDKGSRTTLQNYIQGKLRDYNEVDEIDSLSIVVLNLLVAGYDTSAWSMLSLFAFVLQAPQRIRDKLKEEQDAVVAKHGDKLDRYAMADMKYADAVVKEALRLKGPVPLLMKRAKTDLALNGQRIPEGSVLFLSILTALHSDTQTIKDGPNKGAKVPRHMDIYDLEYSFKPERWLDPATTPTNHGQFAGGMHSCLGAPLYTAEAKVLLAILARHYRFDLVSGPVQWQPAGTIRPLEPIEVRLRPLAAK
ncbi:hypothetical protein WJX73_010093 [Symbiochloris irregularis]|uniref:Cytochrome P450 n=1 Tax=Symbiochloris irregularis TaxID=706552 RepID=A0AAW1NS40_9CHLO